VIRVQVEHALHCRNRDKFCSVLSQIFLEAALEHMGLVPTGLVCILATESSINSPLDKQGWKSTGRRRTSDLRREPALGLGLLKG
jgi:hypothetical protein